MKRIWLVLMVLVGTMMLICGCSEDIKEEEVRLWQAPNWTQDGKVCFLEHYYVQKWKHEITGDTQAGGSEKITVYEINKDGGGLKKVATVKTNEFKYGPELGSINSSSAGDWVVFSIEDWNIGDHYPVMYVIKRDGTNQKEIGSGQYPDFSPDAEKIVYQKKDEGIWIMNRDGTNNHQIIGDGNAVKPVWSPDGTKIAYDLPGVSIIDTSGQILKFYDIERPLSPDWNGSPDTLGLGNGLSGKVRFININTDSVLEIETYTGGDFRWSFSGNKFIGYDENGYFTIDRSGTNK